MRIVTLNLVLVCIAECHAKELEVDHTSVKVDQLNELEKLLNNVVDKLSGRVLTELHRQHADLENTTLGKPGSLGVRPSNRLAVNRPRGTRGSLHPAVGMRLVIASGPTGRQQRLAWPHAPLAHARQRGVLARAETEEGTDSKVVACRDASADQEIEEIRSDDPMVEELEAECARLNGQNWNPELGLSQLLSPSTVVNSERDIRRMSAELDTTTDADERTALQAKIDAKKTKMVAAMRVVMPDWLKATFVGQSALSVVVCGLLAYDALPGFPNLDFAARVLGFWGIWLFTIPSLRARRPGGTWGMSEREKNALDISFLLTPLTNLGAPFITKNPANIFWANVAVITACYGWSFLKPEDEDQKKDSKSGTLGFVLSALDFGSGRERGKNREVFDAENEARQKTYMLKEREKEAAENQPKG